MDITLSQLFYALYDNDWINTWIKASNCEYTEANRAKTEQIYLDFTIFQLFIIKKRINKSQSVRAWYWDDCITNNHDHLTFPAFQCMHDREWPSVLTTARARHVPQRSRASPGRTQGSTSSTVWTKPPPCFIRRAGPILGSPIHGNLRQCSSNTMN